MKKTAITILLLILTLGFLTACGSSEPAATEPEGSAATEESTEATVENESDTLVAFFSLTGNTKAVAEKIAAVTGGELYEITAAEPYTDEDIDYNDENCRATKEQNDDSARPAFAGEAPSLEGVKTLYLGYPIWYGHEPRIMDTFVEAVDLEGVTVIPFCTSDNSPIGDSGKDLEKVAGGGTWLKGERFESDVSEDELRQWIEGMK